jgi:hypothetical protein
MVLGQRYTCGDAQAGAHCIQRGSVALAGDLAQAMLGCPLAAHMVGRLEGRLPIHPGTSAHGGSRQDVHACSQQFLGSPAIELACSSS